MAIDLRRYVRDIPDFPKRGIVFKDIMPLLADPEALTQTIDLLADWAEERRPQVVIGGEARGFFIGSAIAYKLGCGFVPARRPGKLPPETVSATYQLEYGTNALELHPDLIPRGSRVLIHALVDIATGPKIEGAFAP